MAGTSFHRLLVLFRPVFYGATVVLCLVLLMASRRHQAERPVTAVDIHLEQQTNNFFLDLNNVKALIGADQRIIGAPASDVRLASIERNLRATGYVEQVHAYLGASGKLNLNIRLRQPIARVMDTRGNSFYVDAEGHRIRLSPQFTARTLLVRGRFHESLRLRAGSAAAGADTLTDSTLRSLMPLVRLITADPFFRAQLSELVLEDSGDIILYPEVGSTPVVFGRNERSEEKMATLRAFYHQVLASAGWDYYKRINLKFAGQVVAEKYQPDTPDN